MRSIAIAVVAGLVSGVGVQSVQGPVPGPEHQKLEVFAGAWNFEGETKAVPALGMNDAGRVTYQHVSQMANGGFFLETRRTGISSRGPMTELFVYSYSPLSKTYRQDCYDSRGRVRTFVGTVDGLTWSFLGTNTSAAGQVTKERYTLTYSSDLSTATVRSEHSSDEVVWFERLTGKYTKTADNVGRRNRAVGTPSLPARSAQRDRSPAVHDPRLY